LNMKTIDFLSPTAFVTILDPFLSSAVQPTLGWT
jgi:hypothetical protein